MSGVRTDRPAGAPANAPGWGSDVAATMLRELGLKYVALNPGASFRGLHDSLVNFLGNADPALLLCLHEEHAVAMAHGWWKATDTPMGVAVHSNVGLMHASMAIFNAWCDRAGVIVVGATGPLDAARRRPWIDWIHTSRDQAAMVRPFLKWDDTPASVPALVESFRRAGKLATTAPCGPVYVVLDAGLQEMALDGQPADTGCARFAAPAAAVPAPASVEAALALIAAAERPALLVGRGSLDGAAWQRRVALAERLGAAVLTDLKLRAAFPTDHPLCAAPPATFLTAEGRAALAAADLVLALEWTDLGGTLRQAFGADVTAKVIEASVDLHAHNGWSMDHQALAAVDVPLLCGGDAAVAALLAALPTGDRAPWHVRPPRKAPPAAAPGRVGLVDVAAALEQAAGGRKNVSFAALPRGFPLERWPFHDPLAYLGKDGGGGVGSGLGLALGAALALAGTGRLAVAVIGDGDYLMGSNALWTAAHHDIPLLVIVANNRSYYNDELHQEAVARTRGREPKNRWIGQAIVDPAPDLAAIARGHGVAAWGPVETAEALAAALAEAVATVRAGKPAVVDVAVAVGGERAMNEAMQERTPAHAG